jgi:hypothetical protein
MSQQVTTPQWRSFSFIYHVPSMVEIQWITLLIRQPQTQGNITGTLNQSGSGAI